MKKVNGQTDGVRTGLTNGSSHPAKAKGSLRANAGEGRIDSITRGNALTGGLINGNGIRNGGFINGSGSKIAGYVNGYRSKGTEPYEIIHIKKSIFYKKKSHQRQVIETITVMAICCVLMVIPFATTWTIHKFERITIDGIFDDWKNDMVNSFYSTSYYSNTEELNEHINIEQYSVDYEYSRMKLYVKTTGEIFNCNEEETDSINIFIDIDSDLETGYKIKGIGADIRILIYGINKTIHHSNNYYYCGEGRDWSWYNANQIISAMNGNEIELLYNDIYSRRNRAEPLRMTIAIQDAESNLCLSDSFNIEGNLISTNINTKTIKNGGITIDGNFEDWNNIENKYIFTDTNNRLDIKNIKDINQDEVYSFYLKTHGNLFSGNIPENVIVKKVNESNQIINEVNNTVNKPIIRDDETQNSEGNDSMIVTFGNERILVKGIYDEIYQSDLQEFIDEEWITVKEIKSAVNGQQFETQVCDYKLKYDDVITVQVSDWKSRYDFVALDYRIKLSKVMSTMGSQPIQPNEVIDTSTSNDATIYGFQRKCFRDTNNYYWAMFYDGTNTVIERSDDTSGSSWTGTQYGICSGQGESSLWYDDSTKIWISFTNSYDIIVREGTLSGNPTTLSLGTNSTALDGTDTDDAYSRSFITLSSSGYVWVSAKYVDNSNDKYIYAVRSTNIGNSPSGWESSTAISGADNSEIANSNILPLASDDIYCLWRQDGNLYGASYDGSWDTPEDLGSVSNQEGKGMSAVVDSNYYVNLVFVNSAGNLIFRQRTSSWQSNVTIDDTDSIQYPSLTIDPNDDNMSVLYTKANDIYKSDSTDGGSTWNTPYVIVSGVSSLKWLSASYHFQNNYAIFVYQSGSGAPYDVNAGYYQIPEITEIIKIVMPVIIPIIALAGISYTRARRKK